ncbi:MAG TPA: acyl-CoA thioesterase, partial [Thermodesulfobacteriota bacterium]|nr:acyl-CoA thioesterase [Thermodesulfobacteriota bacterium]
MRQWIDAEVRVRFEEVDPWQIVWYGRYLSYFEVARTILMEKFELLAYRIVLMGYRTPIVSLHCQFKA